MTDDEFLDKAVEALLHRWDSNEILQTVELGGIGPAYEQCIHIAVFEFLRRLLKDKVGRDDESMKWKKLEPIFKEEASKLDYLGLSGAQYNMAVALAAQYYLQGYKKVIEPYNDLDRIIMINKYFPHAPGDDGKIQPVAH